MAILKRKCNKMLLKIHRCEELGGEHCLIKPMKPELEAENLTL